MANGNPYEPLKPIPDEDPYETVKTAQMVAGNALQELINKYTAHNGPQIERHRRVAKSYADNASSLRVRAVLLQIVNWIAPVAGAGIVIGLNEVVVPSEAPVDPYEYYSELFDNSDYPSSEWDYETGQYVEVDPEMADTWLGWIAANGPDNGAAGTVVAVLVTFAVTVAATFGSGMGIAHARRELAKRINELAGNADAETELADRRVALTTDRSDWPALAKGILDCASMPGGDGNVNEVSTALGAYVSAVREMRNAVVAYDHLRNMSKKTEPIPLNSVDFALARPPFIDLRSAESAGDVMDRVATTNVFSSDLETLPDWAEWIGRVLNAIATERDAGREPSSWPFPGLGGEAVTEQSLEATLELGGATGGAAILDGHGEAPQYAPESRFELV